MSTPIVPQSKLPALGTTIFTRMSSLAQRHQAINLSQGFPDFDGPDYFRLAWHVSQGANQYAPMTGVAPLREAIAEREIYVLSDEVYEHIGFADGGHHI